MCGVIADNSLNTRIVQAISYDIISTVIHSFSNHKIPTTIMWVYINNDVKFVSSVFYDNNIEFLLLWQNASCIDIRSYH